VKEAEAEGSGRERSRPEAPVRTTLWFACPVKDRFDRLLDGPESVRAGDGRHVYGASHPPRSCRPPLERGGRFDQEDREVDGILQRQELVRDGHCEAREHLLSKIRGLRGVQVHVLRHYGLQSRVVPAQEAPGYLVLPAEGDAEVVGAFFYGCGRVGDRNLKNTPVRVALVETADQKHHGVGFGGCVRGAPLASKEVAQPGGKFLNREARLCCQLCLKLR
jgi:hypothetical protein